MIPHGWKLEVEKNLLQLLLSWFKNIHCEFMQQIQEHASKKNPIKILNRRNNCRSPKRLKCRSPNLGIHTLSLQMLRVKKPCLHLKDEPTSPEIFICIWVPVRTSCVFPDEVGVRSPAHISA